jgi:hypothetical protein
MGNGNGNGNGNEKKEKESGDMKFDLNEFINNNTIITRTHPEITSTMWTW